VTKAVWLDVAMAGKRAGMMAEQRVAATVISRADLKVASSDGPTVEESEAGLAEKLVAQ
jgi:hypothetical protein